MLIAERIARGVLEESRVVADQADWIEYTGGARWDLRLVTLKHELKVSFFEEELEDLPGTPEIERRIESRIRDRWRTVRSAV